MSDNTIKTEKKAKRCPASTLAVHTMMNFEDGQYIVNELSYVSKEKAESAVLRRYRLQCMTTKREIDFGNFLLNQGIEFIHKAPISAIDKVHFVDFYIPNKKLAIMIRRDYEETAHPQRYANIRQDLQDLGITVLSILHSDLVDFDNMTALLRQHVAY